MLKPILFFNFLHFNGEQVKFKEMEKADLKQHWVNWWSLSKSIFIIEISEQTKHQPIYLNVKLFSTKQKQTQMKKKNEM